MSNKTAWKTNHDTNSAPSISYAERLRRANQKTIVKSDTPSVASRTPPEFEKAVADAKQRSISTSSLKPTTPASPSLEEKAEAALYTTNQSSSSGSQPGSINVWEERMRQRKFKHTGSSNQSGGQPKADSSGSAISPKRGKSVLSVSSNSKNVNPESDPSLEGIPDNAWLQRIYMLNGGERRAHLTQRTAVKSDTCHSELQARSEDESMCQNFSSQKVGYLDSETTCQPWIFPPDVEATITTSPPQAVAMPLNHIVKSDGSYLPHRISDPPMAAMSGIGPRLPFMNMVYAPKVPTSRNAPRGNASYRAHPNKGYDPFRYHQYSASMPNSATMLPYVLVPAIPMSQGITPNPEEHGPSPDASGTGSSMDDLSGTEDDAGETRSVGDKYVPYHNTGAPYMTHPAFPGSSPTPYMVPFQPFVQMPYPGVWPYYAGQPLSAPIQPAFDTNSLLLQLRGQVEFYFSDENLTSDLFLRKQMDSDGFVQLRTILGFKRIQAMLQGYQGPENSDVSLLQTALQSSSLLSLDADKMRVRRNSNWQSFVLLNN